MSFRIRFIITYIFTTIMERLTIDDCTECPYDLCETDSCKGPKDLPNALIRNFEYNDNGTPNPPKSGTDCLTGCSLEQKATYCCYKNQISEESVIKIFPDEEIGIKALRVCPSLDIDGLCSDYEKRPDICKKFKC